MNKIIVCVIALLVGVGLGYSIPHGATVQQSGPVGGPVELDSHFIYGLWSGTSDQLSVDSSGNLGTSGTVNATTVKASLYTTATVGSSSSSPAALGSAAAGHFVIAAGSTTANASTTAVTANSTVSMTLEKETPIAGTTCNTTVNASSSPMQVNKIAGNGFIVTIPSAPVTNPFCVAYRVTN